VEETRSRPAAAVADALEDGLDRLVEEVIEAVVAAVPPFQEWLDGDNAVRRGVDQGLRGFVELLRSGDDAHLPGQRVYFDFGRVEHRAGRSLDAVLTAYRVGAQAAWRGMARDGEAAGVDPHLLYALAESIFAYIDRISSATAEGFAHEQSLAASERADTRHRLAELLLRDPPADADAVEEAAVLAQWRIPVRESRPVRELTRRLSDTISARVDGVAYVVVPDPGGPGRDRVARAILAGCRAGLGPVVDVRDARESARQARLALDLSSGQLVAARDHRVELLLAQDPALARALAGELGDALALLSSPAQERLVQTLEAWLAHQGEVRPTADALHVHVQTVRYRLAQLRELLGDRLDTAGGRLELELALRARRLGHRLSV
jgi:PucR C-terminal helix-turn-helix domain